MAHDDQVPKPADEQPDENLTMETEARRYEQIRGLEKELQAQDARIKAKADELKELRKTWDAILEQLRKAARNEGDLPLFSGEV